MVKKNKKKTYQEQLMESAKGTVKLGLTSMVGMGTLSAMGNVVPGASGIAGTASTALNLVNIGNLGKVGMDITKGF
jgi:hypothetical protein